GNAFPASEFELVLNRHDREERAYFNSIWEPLRQGDGRINGFIVVAHEVTTQVVARKQAEESEAKLRSLIGEAPVATALFVGPQMRIELANELMVSYFGRGPSILGKPIRDVLTAPSEAQAVQLLDEVFRTGNPYEAMGAPAELVINNVAGTYYFNISLKPLRNASGEIYAVLEMAVDVTAQVLAQKELQASEARFRSIVKQAPMAIGLLGGREMVIEVVNDHLLAIWGKQASITGLRLVDALPQIEGQGLIELLEGVYDTGEPFTGHNMAVQLERNDQMEDAYFDFVYTPLRDTDQSITGVMILASEVTQEVRARRAIEASEVKLRSVIASAPAAIGLFVGRELRVELTNQAFIDIVGKGPDIVGKPLREVMPELLTENQPFLQILDEVYTTGQMFQSYGSRVDIVRQGVMTHNYYNITYTPLRDETGQIYAILDIAIDVTEEIKARQQLAEAEEALRGAIELAKLGTWSLEPATGVVTFSERIRSWFGFEDQETLDTVYNPIHEHDRQRVADAIANALKPESGGVYKEEYRVVHYQTGQERILHAQGQTFFDDQGKPVKIVGTAQDVTEQRQRQLTLEQQVQQQTEELAAANKELASQNEEYVAINERLIESTQQLERSNENLQRFAYIASHDLQEPLRKVQQFGDLLKSGYGGQLGEGLAYLERMQSAASRMSTLIRDLLEFSRISTQRETGTPVSLEEVIERVLATLELVITETNAQVRIQPLPTVLGDAPQLSQLFQNLLSNALKFHRPGVQPVIRISAQWVSADHLPEKVKPTRGLIAYHRIDVADNGIGFEEKYLDRIFEVFQRLHGRNEYAGTGVGLAICEKVAFNHGGAITASSQPGQGATFSVYLPVL
ncbi:MAG TPA: PAS domain-containing protein, partial [Spirosoma sp.]|nr:PAS domain-containing protein [Spirosoma sp.]